MGVAEIKWLRILKEEDRKLKQCCGFLAMLSSSL
jgi:hypothetical protein